MKKSKCTEEQIIGVMAAQEAGLATADVRRRGGRKRATGTRPPLAVPSALNQC